jgi:hypothetical protein
MHNMQIQWQRLFIVYALLELVVRHPLHPPRRRFDFVAVFFLELVVRHPLLRHRRFAFVTVFEFEEVARELP